MTPEEKILAAAKEGNVFGLREAIQSNVNVNLQSKDYGMTALHYVANGGYQPCALELIENGNANMDIKDNDGQTALMLASTRQASVEVAKLLIAKGADLDITNRSKCVRPCHLFFHFISKSVQFMLLKLVGR